MRLFEDAADREPDALGLNQRTFARLYLFGQGIPKDKPRPSKTGWKKARPPAAVKDDEDFVAAILNADSVSRQTFIEDKQLSGTQMPAPVFQKLIESLRQDQYKPRVREIAWLRDVAKLSSPEQLADLYRDCNVLGELLTATGSETLT
jgi:hypothetical protein